MKMKKLFILIAFAFMASCEPVLSQTYQLFSVTPFTQIEKVGGEWKMTAPITLQYNLLKSFGKESNYFIGAGVGAGVDFNGGGNGTINLNIPITAYVGGQLFAGFPSIAFGGGFNAQSGNAILMVNLHFTSTQIFPGIEKASPRYTPLVNNSNYKETHIGFKHD